MKSTDYSPQHWPCYSNVCFVRTSSWERNQRQESDQERIGSHKWINNMERRPCYTCWRLFGLWSDRSLLNRCKSPRSSASLMIDPLLWFVRHARDLCMFSCGHESSDTCRFSVYAVHRGPGESESFKMASPRSEDLGESMRWALSFWVPGHAARSAASFGVQHLSCDLLRMPNGAILLHLLECKWMCALF